ncbi:MAG: hypothetical protein LC795_06105 [Acidobacteria bacterium]|nr:hypothetical protein [Acidobacteriota bacterium]
MRNRASTHLLLLLLIVGLEVVGYVAVYDSALLRGYEPSVVGAVRDLLLYAPLIVLLFWLSRVMRFKGSWALYTTAVLLFSVGLLVQYRLYSDPEYGSGNKAQARAEKTQVQRLRYISQFYGPEKKQAMGLDPTAAEPEATPEVVRRSNVTVGRALFSSFTWVPLVAFFALAAAYWFCTQDRYLDWAQRHSFVIVLGTLLPLLAAVVWSSAGKFGGNMTPWEPSKIPFLLGFAGILTMHYRELARTYWGMPRSRPPCRSACRRWPRSPRPSAPCSPTASSSASTSGSTASTRRRPTPRGGRGTTRTRSRATSACASWPSRARRCSARSTSTCGSTASRSSPRRRRSGWRPGG